MHEYRITPDELLEAAMAGVRRRVDHIRDDDAAQRNLPSEDRRWDNDINGAVAEYVFQVKHLGQPWRPARCGEHDADRQYEIRQTCWPNGGLLIQETDHDDVPYVLVVGSRLRWRVVGWAFGGHAKLQMYWWDKTGRPCYRMPQRDLRPIETLPVKVQT